MNSTREAIKRKHKVQQMKTQVKRFDREIERLQKRPRSGEIEKILNWLQTARDNTAQRASNLLHG